MICDPFFKSYYLETGTDSARCVDVVSLVYAEEEVEHVGIILGPRAGVVHLLVLVYRNLQRDTRFFTLSHSFVHICVIQNTSILMIKELFTLYNACAA